MLSRFVAWLVALACVTLALPALAWDASELQYASADGELPGGGGIVGTGSRSDQRTECGHCHIDADGAIALIFAPSPAFASEGDGLFYAPEQEYEFTVSLTGEHLGLADCPTGAPNANMMAATFEDAAGANVGTLESDTGQMQGASCPPTPPEPNSITTGTTLLAVDCRVILTRDAMPGGNTRWKFRWTAPPAGTGDVTLYGGAVDSNCDMNSRGDDVKMVKLTLSEGPAIALGAGKLHGPARRVALADVAPASKLVPVLLVLALLSSALRRWPRMRRRQGL
jgi:hypothetical protein